jgi:phenylacetate-CoA ligase
MRASIENVFGCAVFDEYGARELGPLAHECEAHAGLHVNAESYVVEVVRDGRPARDGELGEVLVTDLNSRTVPLIRYQLPDLAVAAGRPCACGRGLPLLAAVTGRPASGILDARGRCVPGAVFCELFRDHEHAVTRFQVAQSHAGAVTVRAARKSRFTPETEATIRERLARALGTETRVTLEIVDALPAGAGAPVPTCVSVAGVPLSGAGEPAGREADACAEVSG